MEEVIKIGRKEYNIIEYFNDEGKQFCVGKTLLTNGILSYRVIGFNDGKPFVHV